MKIPEDWTFKDRSVAKNFDTHVAEQLPWYYMAQSMVAHLIRCYLPCGGTLIDLGCSTGGITKSVKDVISARGARAVSVDNSKEMIDIFDGCGEKILGDMTDNTLFKKFDVCCVFLSIMFLPVKERGAFIDSLIEKKQEGGAIIIVDKVTQSAGYLGASISKLTISNKMSGNNSSDDILKKELSLCGIQRPICPDLLESKGFVRWLQIGEFVGWIKE